ncbi:hypothetical protein IPC95_09595 [Pseudomonas aeruginosa]|nr:hypothetical protein IPC95_09595 [Pseudomonas aeruginosa]
MSFDEPPVDRNDLYQRSRLGLSLRDRLEHDYLGLGCCLVLLPKTFKHQLHGGDEVCRGKRLDLIDDLVAADIVPITAVVLLKRGHSR